VVLEAGPEVGHVWRSRWDSLTLFTPAQYEALPGMPFPAPADTYRTKDPVADYLQAYAAAFELPVRLNARATDLRHAGDEFEVRTAAATVRARQVVVATGPFQVPVAPTGGRQAGRLRYPGPQRRVPKAPGPAGGAGAGGGGDATAVPMVDLACPIALGC
jgi:putative flavoprotein involved in K+ transport